MAKENNKILGNATKKGEAEHSLAREAGENIT